VILFNAAPCSQNFFLYDASIRDAAFRISKLLTSVSAASVGRSESDVKKPDLSQSDQELSDGGYRPISEHASNDPMSDIGLGLVASQPTHASILLLMTFFA
jgi:hypothetical protein